MHTLSDDAIDRALRVDRLAITGHLAAGFAHELNNALSVSSLALTLSQRAVASGEVPEAEDLDSLTSTHTDIAGAAAALLTLSGSGRPQAPERLSARAAVTSALEMLQRSGRMRRTDLDWRAEGDAVHLVCAHADLEHLVFNLVLNGTAHQRLSGQRGQLRIALGVEGERAELSFEDDGPPLAKPGETPQLWQADRLGVAQVGLGLWAAHALVARLGARLHVESPPGGRARAVVTLAIAPATDR